jgi:hypothetical protein
MADVRARDFDIDRRLFAITIGDSKSCRIWKSRCELTWPELAEKLSH